VGARRNLIIGGPGPFPLSPITAKNTNASRVRKGRGGGGGGGGERGKRGACRR